MEIARGQLLDSERVEDGEDEFEIQEVDGDLIISRSRGSNLYALPPPLRQEDIGEVLSKKAKMALSSRKKAIVKDATSRTESVVVHGVRGPESGE